MAATLNENGEKSLVHPSHKGLMVVLSGPSGAGKSSIIADLLKKNANAVHSISVTTRTPRTGEIPDVSYYFTTRDRFEALVQEGKILEYDTYCGAYYGTPEEPVRRHLAAGRDVFFDLTVAGALQIREKCPDAVLIFITPPSIEDLVTRLSARGTEKKDALEARLKVARGELRAAVRFDYCVVNDVLEDAVDTIASIIRAEKCRVSRFCVDGIPMEKV